jgi:hypothetical protein
MELPGRPEADERETHRRSLPSGAPKRTWAGRGTNGPCDFCGQTIPPDQVEYEVELQQQNAGRVLHMHFECYQAWAITARRTRT